jgi:hypothetical protein
MTPSNSDYIASSFDLFKASHKDYLETYSVKFTPDGVEIHLMFWLYDLLDQDLDFSEDYYQTLQETFRDWIARHAKVVAAECKTKISIVEYKQIFRNVSEFMSRQTFEYITDSQVRNTVERLLKV